MLQVWQSTRIPDIPEDLAAMNQLRCLYQVLRTRGRGSWSEDRFLSCHQAHSPSGCQPALG